MFESEIDKGGRGLQVDHAGLVHHDPITPAEHELGRPAVDDPCRPVRAATRQTCPYLGSGCVSVPAVAVVGEQRVQARRRGTDFARCDGCRLPGRRDHQHPSPLSSECPRARRAASWFFPRRPAR